MPEQVEQAQFLGESLKTFAGVFGNDISLIAQAAADHGINTTSGSIVMIPESHAYNLRIPQGSEAEIDVVLKALIIVFGCIDARQSAELVENLNPDAWFLIAGGGTQPESNRLNTLINTAAVIHRVNPSAKLIFLGHDMTCGGVNFFLTQLTGKGIVGIQHDDEVKLLWHHLEQLSEGLKQQGVPQSTFQLGIANIGHDNRFSSILYK